MVLFLDGETLREYVTCTTFSPKPQGCYPCIIDQLLIQINDLRGKISTLLFFSLCLPLPKVAQEGRLRLFQKQQCQQKWEKTRWWWHQEVIAESQSEKVVSCWQVSLTSNKVGLPGWLTLLNVPLVLLQLRSSSPVQQVVCFSLFLCPSPLCYSLSFSVSLK